VLLAELQQDSFRGAVRQLLSEAQGAGQPVNLMERLRGLVKRQIGGTLGSGGALLPAAACVGLAASMSCIHV
jgi:hypothetical protein